MDENSDAGVVRSAEDRPRGVPKAKLTDVDLGPKLSIFYRPRRNAPMVPLVNSISKGVAAIFCDRIRAEVENNNIHSYVITGGDPSAYKRIFAWIDECGQTQSIEKFPDIPEPEGDPFTATINVIMAGEQLGIPAGSLSFHLRKRLNGCARKQLMPFSQVRDCYDMESDAYNIGLKDVACASVFNAWWEARLDESVNPELMEELGDMRYDLTELDHDLHDACKKREEDVRKKWAEKKAKRIAEQSGGGDRGGDERNNTGSTVENVTTDGDWENTSVPTGQNSWDTPNQGLTQAPTPVSADWDVQNTKPMIEDALQDLSRSQKDIKHGLEDENSAPVIRKDWADEMNEPVEEPPQTVPMIQW